MSFETRHRLMQLVSNNVEAYTIAQTFVADNEQKFEVFRDAFLEDMKEDKSSQASTAVDKSRVRWEALFPPEQV